MWFSLISFSICKAVSANVDFARGKQWPKGGWKKEYLTRHTGSKIHKASKGTPILQKQAEQVITLDNMTLQGSTALMKNVMFVCKEKMAVLKAESIQR